MLSARSSLRLLFLSAFFAPWLVSSLSFGQTEEEKARLMKEQRTQAICLQRCMDTYYKKYYGCGSEDRLLCNMQHDIYFKPCLLKCRAAWFCPGFRQTVQLCPTNCLKDAEKHLPKKRYDKRRKRWFKPPAKEVERWQARSRFACTRVCKIMADVCTVDYVPRLPNPTSIDELMEKIR